MVRVSNILRSALTHMNDRIHTCLEEAENERMHLMSAKFPPLVSISAHLFF